MLGIEEPARAEVTERSKEYMMQILGPIFFLLVLWASGAEASCIGSGMNWNCAAGATPSDVQSAVNSAADGATIIFDVGAYSWISGIALSDAKGVTLVCSSIGGCTVTVGGGFIISLATSSNSNTKLYRVSGFEFQNAPAGTYTIAFYGTSDNVKMTQIRIDHNTFRNYPTNAVGVLLGDNSKTNVFYGVYDHNTITGPITFLGLVTIGKVWTSQPESSYPGTANNFFCRG